ncbi:putative signal transducing protein [Vibrio coralliilyticus]|uniref:putative signal transducing protein n=1 Tax=Vibrio coralliilyticus TaxID=190893 RepID=UPI0006CCF7C1|nr:DUF2007 domain-containing protein [Vibrio coralliilyticus]AXN31038.1 DUF2007 domain-containing protein [Vibrio coralliilyticus]KPH27417.1 hypothetical protein ADU60_03945 [Vibrio coralliilyticus]
MKIFTANNPPEAHIVCELLKSNRIPCEVQGEGMFGLQGEVPFGENSQPYIWLLDSKMRNQASAIIEQYMQQTLIGSEWQCEECGEANEAQFAICWQCGAAGPA